VSDDFRLGYRPTLDGLRGVSILAVMLYHTGLLSGGFLGVDVFFVLSGFLITSLLLDEIQSTGGVALRAFYIRRGLRLLPALVPMILVTGVAMLAWDPGWETIVFLLSVVFYAANWAIAYGLPPGMLGHTWSLSIEEQFYALWPPLLLFLLRVVRRRGALLALMAVAVIAAVGYRLLLARAEAARLYVGLDAHADPLLVGCLLGLFYGSSLFRRTPRALVTWNVLGALGGIALLALFWGSRYPEDYVRACASTSTAIVSALVIVAAMQPSAVCASLLAREPLPWIGRRSYALYLWHFPFLFMTGALWVPGRRLVPIEATLAWVLTFAAAAASFRYIEQPALRLKATLGRRRPAVGAPALLGAD